MGKNRTSQVPGTSTQTTMDQFTKSDRDLAVRSVEAPEAAGGDLSAILQAISASQVSVEAKIG